ncbi:MAG: ABC transporter permease [Chthoniobacterales bacterium]
MNDLRFAFRTLLKTPSFSLTSVLALGLGIGATTAMFGVIYGFLLRPLPYAEPDRLVMVQSRSTRSGSDLGVNYLDFKDWKEQARSFSDLAFFNLRWNGNLESRDGRTETLKTTFTTANLFDLLGVQPFLGRNLTSADDEPNAPKVMLISHRLWSALGSDERLIGHELRLDGTPHTVIGVMLPGFRFPSQSDLWVPMASVFGTGTNRSWRADQAIARLKDGVTIREAQSEMSVIGQRLAQQYPDTNADVGAAVVGLREHWVGDLRSALLLLLGACGGVLAIACANVSQLLLARASTRERELAVRSALGASRARLVRQLLTESAVLGILGSIAGALLAFWLVQIVTASIPIELPFWVKIDVNRGVLAFAAIISVLTGLVAGTLPAWHATRLDVTTSLKNAGAGGGGTARAGRTRELLTIAQVAVSIVLLIGASLMLRSVLQLRRVDPGFDPHHVLMMEMNPTYNGDESAQVRVKRFADLERSISQLPGVEVAAANNSPPFVPQRPWNRIAVTAEGQSVDQQARNPLANFQTVSPDYFQLLRVPLLDGRLFETRDTLEAPRVCLVSQRMAKAIWPNESPIGRRLKLGAPNDDAHPDWITVVGMVGDVRHQGLEREAGPDLYQCSLQLAWKQMHFLVRARSEVDPLSLVSAIRAQVAATSPETGVFNFVSLEKEVANSLWQPRLQGWLLGFFSIVALTLAAAGLYGAMAYGVAQRTREIGIRMALGATRGAVLRLVLGEGMRAVTIGLVCGLSGALILARVLRASVYGNEAHDLTSYFIASSALAFAALLACWLPARRATSVNPSDALRAE